MSYWKSSSKEALHSVILNWKKGEKERVLEEAREGQSTRFLLIYLFVSQQRKIEQTIKEAHVKLLVKFKNLQLII